MVWPLPGHRSAHSRPRSGGGGNDFACSRASPGSGQNGGAPHVLEAVKARPSCWNIREPGPSPSRQGEVPAARCDRTFLHPAGPCMLRLRRATRGEWKDQDMPRSTSAVSALQKLEAERKALDARQRELESKAAQEVGEVILGTGLEAFSAKGLRQVAEALGRLGEAASLEKLGSRPDGRNLAAPKSSQS